jgi:hypothetical protein
VRARPEWTTSTAQFDGSGMGSTDKDRQSINSA